MSYVPPGAGPPPGVPATLGTQTFQATAYNQASGDQAKSADNVEPVNPEEEEEEEEGSGLSTSAKIAIGAGLGVAALAAVGVGVGAVAVGGYYLHQSHEAKKQNESPLKLNIRAISGHNLKSEDFGGKSDPYLKIEVDHAAVKTKAAKKELNPKWNQMMDLGVYPEQLTDGTNIKISVHDEDTGRNDECLGKANVSFATVPAKRPKRFDLALSEKGSCIVELWLSGPGAKSGERVTPPTKRRQRRQQDHEAASAHRRRRDERNSAANEHTDDYEDDDRRRRRRQRRQDAYDSDEEDFYDEFDDDSSSEEDFDDDRRHKRHNRVANRHKQREQKRRERAERRKERGKGRRRSPSPNSGRVRGQGRGKKLRKQLEDGAIVFLRSNATGKNLRIKRNGSIDAEGGNGKWAKFEVYRSDGERRFRLRNVGDDGNWLAIDGNEVVAEGKNRATEFIGHKDGRGSSAIGIESSDDGNWLAVKPNGDVFAKKKKNVNKVGKKTGFVISQAD